MTATELVQSLCCLVASTFHPDRAAVVAALLVEGEAADRPIDLAEEEAKPTRAELRATARLVAGYVDSSRSEGGYSAAVNADRVERNLRRWCDEWDVDAEQFIGTTTIEDGTNRW